MIIATDATPVCSRELTQLHQGKAFAKSSTEWEVQSIFMKDAQAFVLNIFRRYVPVYTGLVILCGLPLWAQTDSSFVPSLTVGAGLQTNYQHNQPDGSSSSDQFTLDHIRLYVSGDVTKDISLMFNTDYNGSGNSLQVLDAVGQFHFSSKANIWVGRFLPPSDRDNFTGPFYANAWANYTDGIQDGYPDVYQGRDNGVAYWGDFKAGTATIKASVGAFDGASATGDPSIIWAERVQVDFWDPEDGYYLNGTYYGDKNLLAIGVANQVQSGKTATTIDFLMERKVHGGGAFTIESEYSRYNNLGGYNADYARSEGAYALVSFLIPQKVGVGRFELLGKAADAEFTGGFMSPTTHNPSYRQQTTETDLSYIIKQFDARVMAFGKVTSFNAVQSDYWEAGIGLQLQISKTLKFH